MAELELVKIEPWAPHPSASPVTEQNGETLTIAANGTQTCVGGWQATFSGAKPGEAYLVRWEVEHRDVRNVRDCLVVSAYWGDLASDESNRRNATVLAWDFLLPESIGEGGLLFSRCLMAPEGAEQLVLRSTFRWSRTGTSTWRAPEVVATAVPEASSPVSVAVVTGIEGSRKGPFKTIQDNIDFYAPLCEAACATKPDLIVLPEIALQWGIDGSPLDRAVPAPGDETEVFAKMARRHSTHIVVGMLERSGDAVYNSAVLIGPDGGVDGKYRKAHLAVGGEMDSGILPGDSFPVFRTAIGRIGCNICMDSSASESSRMVGLNGADFLLLPIMGDHRAWYPGKGGYDPDRFRVIMRTRAMDNQLCMVVARNNGNGSCIVDHVGDVLAWNEGDEDFIHAKVNLRDGYRAASGGSYQGVNWMQRRPHIYGAYVDEQNVGSLRRDAD